MKLAAIYNVWDGEELLRGSMECLRGQVDLFIIVWQEVSNFGEKHNPLADWNFAGIDNVLLEKYTPNLTKPAAWNETCKRNAGIELARMGGCTHFLHLDCDEYYDNFAEAKRLYIQTGRDGSACRLHTYFKHPQWRLDVPENYYVPFIHKIYSGTSAVACNYPVYCDRTRRISGITPANFAELPVYMHHFSWVRRDIKQKARNSSAKTNIDRGTLLHHYHNPELDMNPEGYYLPDLDRRLTVVPNLFNIPYPL